MIRADLPKCRKKWCVEKRVIGEPVEPAIEHLTRDGCFDALPASVADIREESFVRLRTARRLEDDVVDVRRAKQSSFPMRRAEKACAETAAQSCFPVFRDHL